ncbi:hypothetical protein ACTWP6_09960 [Mycobacterium sp. 4D054]|uniref:hypothetical protein n=1 Tax=Mycobacterium sp. 4D054 TaxID=3457440 RepID=UPI003FD0571F
MGVRSGPSTGPGHGGRHMFADVVAEFAAHTHDPRLRAVPERLRDPLRVAVRGRSGVGCGSVARALAASGVPVVTAVDAADAQVIVVAEVLKPEDRALLTAPVPTVIVLNKADLAGRVVGGPLAAATACAARISGTAGVAVVPMIALLARPELDGRDVAALRTLAATPADMTSTDAFVDAEHPVPAEVRRRLLARLDRFGLAHAVLSCAEGADAATVNRALRDLSQVGRVVAAVDAMTAEVTYRRVCAAVDDLHRVAAETRDDGLAGFLAGDDAVIAVMAAAVDAMEATGLRVDRGDSPDAHERRAVYWHRYAGGPVTGHHGRCAAAIARGSLRLLSRSR